MSDAPSDPVTEALRDVLAHRPTADEVSELLTASSAVAAAELRSGLIKTEPPQRELRVEPADGGPVRTYDLVEQLDGTVTLGREHSSSGAPEDVPADGETGEVSGRDAPETLL